ncbi:MAG: HD-GYP domain-containing protein [Chthonomonas sp.]|nr:HD-GYP domain-containing protein [Chthonomonas sp.]
MSQKLMLLITGVAVLFLAGVVVWRLSEQKRAHDLLSQNAATRNKQLDKFVDFFGAQLERMVIDNATDSKLMRDVSRGVSTDYTRGVVGDIVQAGADAVWVVSKNGEKVDFKVSDRDKGAFPANAAALKSLFSDASRSVHYFARVRDGVFIEMRGAKIIDASGRSSGALLVGRRWEKNGYMADLGQITGTTVRVVPIGDVKKTDVAAPYRMPGIDGNDLAVVYFDDKNNVTSLMTKATNNALFIFAIFAMTVFGVIITAMVRWVTTPLKRVSEAMTHGELTALSDIEKAGAEFEQLASLMAQFVLQRDAIAKTKDMLEKRVNERTAELRDAYEATIEGWSRALEFRDQETEGHCRRVTAMTVRLSHEFMIEGDDMTNLRRGALLHDIGKMGIPDSILLKPGKLTEEERHVMEQHTIYAYQMLEPIAFLRPALDIPLYHHEKWDGTGYPYKLKGEQIPLSARIFAVVDVWDALRSDRPYREAWSEERVTSYLIENSGSHFDPAVIQAFLRISDAEKLGIRASVQHRRAA